jgi:hypothetical protein
MQQFFSFLSALCNDFLIKNYSIKLKSKNESIVQVNVRIKIIVISKTLADQ